MINRSYTHYRLQSPKTKASRATVYIPASLYQELLAMKPEAAKPENWIFPASRKSHGTVPPMDYHNWLNRKLKPVAKRLKLPVNFQILRRTFATLFYNTTPDLKLAQQALRHENVSTTAKFYTKVLPASLQNASELYDARLSKQPPRKEPGTVKPITLPDKVVVR